MNEELYNPWLHRLAWLTAIVALLPISVGAVVTTVDAGMAFADWPTSHGQGMLAFPWWQSRGDEFLEHGHRLAGMLTGLVTLLLAAVALMTECRTREKVVVGCILAGVIVQGLLGGWRVLADERVIAMLHAIFAAVIFSLMAVLVAMSSRRWQAMSPITRPEQYVTAALSAGVFLTLLSVQYVLGGLLRHLGLAQAWLIHPWLAVLVGIAALCYAYALIRTGSSSLKQAALWVVGFVALQIAIGVVTWGVRYGFPMWDIVAVQQSTLQVAVRSLHKVVGLLTFMATVVSAARLWGLRSNPIITASMTPALHPAGGVA